MTTQRPPVVPGLDLPMEVLTMEEQRRIDEKIKATQKRRLDQVYSAELLGIETSEPPPPPGSSLGELTAYNQRMKKERIQIYSSLREAERLKEAPLAKSQQREFKKRLAIQAKEMKDYFMNHPLDQRSFKSNIQSGIYNVYVFSFGYAKVESHRYKDFIKSLNSVNFGKVYFGPNTALSRIAGIVPYTEFNPAFKVGDKGYRGTRELLPGLHKIASLLDADDVGALLTTQPKDVVLSRFREYRELDFVKPGQTPMEPLAYRRGDVLPLPQRSSAIELCTKLQGLHMPVELNGGVISLTDDYSVCKDGERVTKEAAQILKLLKIRMFCYVLLPLGCWSASTRDFDEYFRWDKPRSM